MRKFLLGTVATVPLAVGLGGPASAAPITTPGLTLTSNGTTFSNFGCIVTNSQGGINTTPNSCSGQFGIDASVDGAGNLILTANFDAAAFLAGTADEDVKIQYQATNPGGISAIDLGYTPVFTVAGFSFALTSVTETAFTGGFGGTPVGTATVQCNSTLSCGGTFNSTTIGLNPGPQTSVYVQKDIHLQATTLGGYADANISFINQSFHTVPEPASLALFGASLLGLGLFGRRRRS